MGFAWDLGLESQSAVKTFVSPATSLGQLDAGSAASLVAAASDVTLIVDADGTVCDLAIRNDELFTELGDTASWIGRKLESTLAPDSRPKVIVLLREARTTAESRWRHLNHLAPDGRSVPVLYYGVQVGENGRVVLFGRDLRAMSQLQQRLMTVQQSLERDYSRMREVETRYRMLFQMSSEAVLIVDPARGRVTEANPAACALLDAKADEIVGLALPAMFEPGSLPALQQHLDAVRGGSSTEVDVRGDLVGGRSVVVRASMFRQDSTVLYLLRLDATPSDALARLPDVKAKLLTAVENAPDGFVVTDDLGNVLTTNAAFIEMVQLPNEAAVVGEPLDRWVGQTGVDLDVLVSNLRQRGTVRFFSTVLRAEDGGQTPVEISAVSVRSGGHPSFGYAIRNVGPRVHVAPRVRSAPRSVEQLTELIGRVALKDLVREATEVIERLAIEAALELTGDNRASAAEMLGLSRQSLYVKLRRYGIGDLGPADGE